jgi:hypothetical protein
MRPLSIACLSAAFLLGCASGPIVTPSSTQKPPEATVPLEKQVERLVALLGDADYRIRQKAGKDIEALPASAMDAVKAEVARSSNMDIRARGMALVQEIEDRAFFEKGFTAGDPADDDALVPIKSWVMRNPGHPSAGLWLMRVGKIYGDADRPRDRLDTMVLYRELFNPDRRKEGHYFDKEEYLAALLAEADAFEDIGESSRTVYIRKYQEALARALKVDGVTMEHPKIEKMSEGIRRHQ